MKVLKPKKRVCIPENKIKAGVKEFLNPASPNLKKKQRPNSALEKPKKNIKSQSGNEGKKKVKNPWQSVRKKSVRERDLVIGFDLGTSSTKIVIQDRQLRKAYAVPFDEINTTGNKYLLPTRLYCDKRGHFFLNSRSTKVTHIKENFMENPQGESQDLVVAYIAFVLMEICHWFWREKQRDYADSKIEWALNIGIPARSWDDTKLSKAMREAGLAAWNLSLTPKKSISIRDIENSMGEAREQIKKDGCNEKKGQLHSDLVKPVPELVAAVEGFAKSRSRRDGMYLIVDVGATTLDISTFILYKNQEEEDTYSILSSDVQLLGAYNLHSHRIDSAIRIYQNKIRKQVESYDGISALPDLSLYQPKIGNKDDEKLLYDDECYLNECSKVLRKVVRETKKCRNPLSDAWTSGVPSFLCGGGSHVELYKKLIPHSSKKLSKAGIRSLFMRDLPKPKNLENDDILPQEYHRLAVSYGLSFSTDSMGRIIPERDIEDLIYEPSKSKVVNRYIGKEMV